MFTIKLYTDDGYRQRIYEAESFTVLRDADGAEITLHMRDQANSLRVDIISADTARPEGWPSVYQRAIIENAAGKTTEIISLPMRVPQGFAPKP